LQLATTLLARSGYDEISLSSLSTGDYTQLPLLIAALMNTCEQSKVSLSLPSLRVKTLTEDIALAISRVRKTGFTIAPEAGTQRLRNVINKGISEADILQTVEGAFTAGWELLKLYFMVGLPTETDEDLEGIVDLVYQVQRTAQRIARARSHGSRKAQLNVGISSFVPKAHTPFQWERMTSTKQLNSIQQMLQQRIRHRAIQLKWHDVNTSYLEGVFARGDRRLGQVLFEAHQLGCRLDGWTEHFDFSKWLKAFEYTQVNPDDYVYREREEHEKFPWEHIRTGISRTYLWQERLKGLRAECTPPCTPGCQRCDLCHDGIEVREAKGEGLTVKGEGPEENENALSPFAFRPSPSSRLKVFRVRAVYSKTGMLRFLSHLDLTRVFQRAVSRIHVPIAYSQGYHPLPQIAFGPALPVGTEGLREYVDLYFSEEVNVEQFVTMMNATLPQGITMLEAHPVELQIPSLSSILNQFVFHVFVPESLVEQGYTVQYFTQYIDHFWTQTVYPVQQFRKKSEVIDLKPFIVSLNVQPGEAGFPLIQMGLRTHTTLTIKPEEVLHLVCEIPYEQVLGCRFVRVFVGTENQMVTE
jgi:radical SAM-linked protein